MNTETIRDLHKKYALNQDSYERGYTHGQVVAEIAVDTVRRNNLEVDLQKLETACLLHDIGAYTLYVPEFGLFREDIYKQHAIIGAAILEEEGFDRQIVDAVRTHIAMGMTEKEIAKNQWKIPYADYTPNSLLAEVLCFADRFHSKEPQFNSVEGYKRKIQDTLPEHVRIFDDRVVQWGEPDLIRLSKKYGHPIV